MQIGIEVRPWWYPLALGVLFLAAGVYTFERTRVTTNRLLAIVIGLVGALFTLVGLYVASSHFQSR
jgi:hypothetical protein